MKISKFIKVTMLLLVLIMILSACTSTVFTNQGSSTDEDAATENEVVTEVTVEEGTAEMVEEAAASPGNGGPGGGNMGGQTQSVSHYPESVDLFAQYEYTDPETGYIIPYNLYLPDGYDESQEYPLVIYIADAGVNSDEVTDPLAQDGATVWATDEEQAKHQAIILVPQYTNTLISSIGSLTEDDHQWSDGLTLVSNLIFSIVDEYSIDESRIYGTGQSQGCMTTIAISDKYPDFYAAQFLVAGQWDAEEMSAMADDNLWIVVSEGDTKAYPGMNEAVANWESMGVPVATSDMWDSTVSAEEFDELVANTLSKGANINYTVFEGGNHAYTWSVAYTIEGIRDWLFAQSK